MQEVDLVVSADWVVPVAPGENDVLTHYSAVVHDGRIVDLTPTDAVAERYIPGQHLERPGHVLMPGLINAHTCASRVLLRGYGDGMRREALHARRVAPAEKRWLSESFVRDGTELAIAEMLLGGTTCFSTSDAFPDVVARIAARLSLRACVGLPVSEASSRWAEDAADAMRKNLKVHDAYKGNPLLGFAFAPAAVHEVTDATFKRVRALADQLELPVQVPLHATAAEVHRSVTDTGSRPLARLDEHGLVTPLLRAIHMTQLLPSDIDLLAERGAHVVHCPEAALKLASGICPVNALHEAGVNVALGTGSAVSNNDLDLFGELRTAALVAKIESNNAAALPAHSALAMATLDSARCLGLGDECGSLEAGKWADMITVDLDRAGTQPVYDPVSQVVHCASRDQVNDVWVAGRQQVAAGRLTNLSASDAIARAKGWRDRIHADTEAQGA
ncbi:MAG: amidohydrolase family protein [Pseudomonadota bacterium]